MLFPLCNFKKHFKHLTELTAGTGVKSLWLLIKKKNFIYHKLIRQIIRHISKISMKGCITSFSVLVSGNQLQKDVAVQVLSS